MNCTLGKVFAPVILALSLCLPAVPAGAVTIDGIAAMVNNKIITILELEKAGKPLLDRRLPTVEKRERDKLKREILTEVLDQLILRTLQRQRAASIGLRVTEFEIDSAISKIMAANSLSEEMFGRALAEQGLSLEEYREQISDQILFSKLMQREIREKVAMTDEAVSAYYEEHKDDYFRPERIRVRHLLVRSTGDEVQEARRRALAILDEVRAGGDFDELVRTHSPETVTGEDTVSGWLARGEFLAELEEVAFALPEGQVSEPIRSQAGFHLIQVVEKQESGHLSLAAVAEGIREKLSRQEMEAGYQAWLENLRAESQVDIRY
jgi:parvulin-like peptidyl-prolyl isomerase